MLQIKHELNNLHAIIWGLCELAPQAPDLMKQIEKIKSIAARAIILTAGESIAEPQLDFAQRVDLNTTVNEIGDMLKSVLVSKNNVKLGMQKAPWLPSVAGNTSWFFQSVLNLCLNARDAMIEKSGKDGGTLTITTGLGSPGVFLSVADTGKGMSDRQVLDLWKPRLSPDRKHGHGLQVVRVTLARMNGKVAVKSELGVGTTFTISLPAI